jgi:exonuclease VII large subunit
MCQERYQTIQQFVPHHLLKRWYALIYDQQGQIISFEKQKNLRAWSRLRVKTHDYRFEVTIDNIEALHQ